MILMLGMVVIIVILVLGRVDLNTGDGCRVDGGGMCYVSAERIVVVVC